MLLAHCLADIDDFMERFFSEDFSYQAVRYNKSYLLPSPAFNEEAGRTVFIYRTEPEKLTTPHQTTMQDGERENLRESASLRSSSQYLLTESEMDEAKTYLADHAELKLAVSALQACLTYYFKGLQNKIDNDFPPETRRTAGDLRKFDQHLSVYLQEAMGFSFIHDLLPVMALSLSKGDGELNQHNLGKALCDAFRMQAFKSQEQRDGKLHRQRHCPFGQHITSLLSRGLVDDGAGGVKVAPNQKPGSLLHSIMVLMRERAELKAEAEQQFHVSQS